MRVKIFRSASIHDLQEAINNFLESNNYDFKDIKWASSDGIYSALIIFSM